MSNISFTKIVASGNDFVAIEEKAHSGISNFRILARRICDRKFGIGADGLLLLGKSRVADVRMRIFNPDGSEAQMCGNGARCTALYSAREQIAENRGQRKIEPARAKAAFIFALKGEVFKRRSINIETKAGIIESEVDQDSVKIKLTEPQNIRLNIPIKVNKRNLRANFIDTGVPHAVIFVEGLDEVYVNEIGRAIRNHKEFSPRGTNVDFVEALGKDLIAIRTYERGVEDETLACGTGSVASALIFALKTGTGNKINVQTQGKEALKVYFERKNNNFDNVWLEGKARIVCKGEYYV